MSRKYSPTISRRMVAEAALEIVDEVGLDGLTIRSVAKAVGVQGPSLYHHYKDRDDLLEDVARLALEEARLPIDEDQDWRQWLVRSNLAYIRALMAHPNVIPLILSRKPRRSREIVADYLGRNLKNEGVPAAEVPAIIDYTEAFVFGVAIVNSSAGAAGERRLKEFESLLIEFFDLLLVRARSRHEPGTGKPRAVARSRTPARRKTSSPNGVA